MHCIAFNNRANFPTRSLWGRERFTDNLQQWHWAKCFPHFMFYICLSLCQRQHMPKNCILFCLVDNKKRWPLTCFHLNLDGIKMFTLLTVLWCWIWVKVTETWMYGLRLRKAITMDANIIENPRANGDHKIPKGKTLDTDEPDGYNPISLHHQMRKVKWHWRGMN